MIKLTELVKGEVYTLPELRIPNIRGNAVYLGKRLDNEHGETELQFVKREGRKLIILGYFAERVAINDGKISYSGGRHLVMHGAVSGRKKVSLSKLLVKKGL